MTRPAAAGPPPAPAGPCLRYKPFTNGRPWGYLTSYSQNKIGMRKQLNRLAADRVCLTRRRNHTPVAFPAGPQIHPGGTL